jgi:hypothetical protein
MANFSPRWHAHTGLWTTVLDFDVHDDDESKLSLRLCTFMGHNLSESLDISKMFVHAPASDFHYGVTRPRATSNVNFGQPTYA